LTRPGGDASLTEQQSSGGRYQPPSAAIESIETIRTSVQTTNPTHADTRPAVDAETLALLQDMFELVRAVHAERLRPLLEKGVPPNLRNTRGDSLLMLASYHGHLEAARTLLEHGADPELRNDMGQTPILGAAYKGNASMVQLLLDHGASVEGMAPDGKTALMMAAMFNRVDIVKLLLAHGADVNAREAKGMSALDLARTMGAPDTPAVLEGATAAG
jgi:hypothetical protein